MLSREMGGLQWMQLVIVLLAAPVILPAPSMMIGPFFLIASLSLSHRLRRFSGIFKVGPI